MCVGIALALSDLPVPFFEEHGLKSRVHDRGGELEVQFHSWQQPRVLPVRHEGKLVLARWGVSRGERSPLPPTGWTWRATVASGYWAEAGAEPVIIPASLGLEGGVWFPILEGVEGLLVRDGRGRPVVYMLCEPPTHYYKVMTRSKRMPALVGQRY